MIPYTYYISFLILPTVAIVGYLHAWHSLNWAALTLVLLLPLLYFALRLEQQFPLQILAQHSGSGSVSGPGLGSGSGSLPREIIKSENGRAIIFDTDKFTAQTLEL